MRFETSKQSVGRYLLLGGVVVLILVLVFLSGIQLGKQSSERVYSESAEVAATEARLMVDFGDGRISLFETALLYSSSTVFDLLQRMAIEQDIELGYKDFGGDLGAFVESVDGVGPDPRREKWWQYWVNNRYGQVGVSAQVISPGDVVEFKFIKGQK